MKTELTATPDNALDLAAVRANRNRTLGGFAATAAPAPATTARVWDVPAESPIA